MRDWLILMAHLIVTIIRIMAPGGARAVVAESLLLKHQLLILNRSRKKAPKLRALDRILLGLGAMLVSSKRMALISPVRLEARLWPPATGGRSQSGGPPGAAGAQGPGYHHALQCRGDRSLGGRRQSDRRVPRNFYGDLTRSRRDRR